MSGRPSPWKHEFLFLPEHEPLKMAICRLLSNSSPKSSSVVFLHGMPGTGKSHFLHAFLEQLALQSENAQPQIVSASTICELVTEAATDKNAKIRLDNFANADFLVCEDIQAFSERFASQKIFTCLMDRILQSGGKIILTANTTIGDVRHLSARLSNRCQCGGFYRLDAPSKESREKLVSHFSRLKCLNINNEGLKLLADSSQTTPRNFMAMFERLGHYRMVKKIATLSLADIQYFLDENNRDVLKISLAKITKEVAKHFELTSAQLRSRQQNQNSVLPRQCAMYLSRELTDKTLASIGTFFGNRSHSTVIHAWKHVGKIRIAKQEINSLLFRVQHSLSVYS